MEEWSLRKDRGEWVVSWRKMSVLTQMFFTYFAITNQLLGFSVSRGLNSMSCERY